MVRNEEEKFARSYSDRAQGIISKANILHRTVTGTKIYILVERYSEAWEYNSSDWKEPETGCQVTKLTAENFDTRFPALGKKSTRKYLGFPPPPSSAPLDYTVSRHSPIDAAFCIPAVSIHQSC